MLKKLKDLRESLDADQQGLLNSALPEGIAKRFFSAEDEGAAQALVEEMNKHLGPRPLVAFKLYKGLLPEQRAIISDLIFDEDDE
jgi:hypothetical protein